MKIKEKYLAEKENKIQNITYKINRKKIKHFWMPINK